MSKFYDKFKALSKDSVLTEKDKEKLVLLIEAHEEVDKLSVRLDYLRDLIRENGEFNKYLWRTADGKLHIIEELEDSHLKNIVKSLKENSRTIPDEIRKEYLRRKLPEKNLSSSTSPDLFDDDEDYDPEIWD